MYYSSDTDIGNTTAKAFWPSYTTTCYPIIMIVTVEVGKNILLC